MKILGTKKKVKYAYASYKGIIREKNQDNYLVCMENTVPDSPQDIKVRKGKCYSDNELFAVFDGMGGEQCGEVAAYLASESIKESLKKRKERVLTDNQCDKDNKKWLNDIIITANKNIAEYMDQNGILSMGTTMASVFLEGSDVTCANVGDSRVYEISDGKMRQVSVDHSSIAPAGRKAPLYQYLGTRDEFGTEPYFSEQEYKKKTKYLICSDGLTDMVEEDRIADIINKKRVSVACGLLLEQALKKGGRDNITIILIELL